MPLAALPSGASILDELRTWHSQLMPSGGENCLATATVTATVVATMEVKATLEAQRRQVWAALVALVALEQVARQLHHPHQDPPRMGQCSFTKAPRKSWLLRL